MIGFAVFALVLVLLLCYAIAIYNGLVRVRNEVKSNCPGSIGPSWIPL